MASKSRKADRARRMAEEVFRKPPKDIFRWPVPKEIAERARNLLGVETREGRTLAREFLMEYRQHALLAGRHLTLEEFKQIRAVKRRLHASASPDTYSFSVERMMPIIEEIVKAHDFEPIPDGQ